MTILTGLFVVVLSALFLQNTYACDGFIKDDLCYTTIIDRPLNFERAQSACRDVGTQLAVIKSEEVFEAAKSYVNQTYSYTRVPYAVFWLDQLFDYENQVVEFPDGSFKSKDELHTMWYPRSP